MSDNTVKPTGRWVNYANNSETETIFAGFWRRVLATFLDTIVMSIVALPLLLYFYPHYFNSDALIQGPMDVLLTWIGPALYAIIFWNKKGATPGKMIMQIQIVNYQTLQQPSIGSLVGRYFSYYVSALTFGLGFLWIAWDKEKRGFHDKLSGTAVIKTQIKTAH